MGWGYRRQKFGNKQCEYKGKKYASLLERDVAIYLESSKDYEVESVQEKIYLSEAKILFKPDFTVRNTATGNREWFEAKGQETAVYRIKRKLWQTYGPGKLSILIRSGKSIKLKEIIEPKKCQDSENEPNED